MKSYVKNLLSILLLISFLLLGLAVGNGTAIAYNDGPYNGWVCPDEPDNSPGSCEENYNATTCTWSGSGCSTSAPAPDEH